MTEEKPKRVRPTVGQVRILEESIACLKEVIKERDDEIHDLEEKLKDYEMRYSILQCRISVSEEALSRLNSRGFWARLFNKR